MIDVIRTRIEDFEDESNFDELVRLYEVNFHVCGWTKPSMKYTEVSDKIAKDTKEPYKVMQRSLLDGKDYLGRYLYFNEVKVDSLGQETYESLIKVGSYDEAYKLARVVVFNNENDIYYYQVRESSADYKFFCSDKIGNARGFIIILKSLKDNTYNKFLEIPDEMLANNGKIVEAILEHYKGREFDKGDLFVAYDFLKISGLIPCDGYKAFNLCCYNAAKAYQNNGESLKNILYSTAKNLSSVIHDLDKTGFEYKPFYIKEAENLSREVSENPFSLSRQDVQDKFFRIWNEFSNDRNRLIDRHLTNERLLSLDMQIKEVLNENRC